MGLLITHPASLLHDTGAHPENAGRIRAVTKAIESADPPLGLTRLEAPALDPKRLELVHDRAHVERVRAACDAGPSMIDMDTPVCGPDSWQAALRAAGGAVDAVDRLLDGEARFAFSAQRPPGHHATPGRAMGFCLFNNVALAVAHALAERGVDRALVLDWDVHHGNGTQDAFYASDRVLFASLHQSPLYPGTGRADEVGEGAGKGFTLNIPMAPGSGGGEFVGAVREVVTPAAIEHRPGLIVVSAGYDAHRDDPLADCRLIDADYGEMAAIVRDLGERLEVPILVCLEGGYEPGALAGSVLATLRALAG